MGSVSFYFKALYAWTVGSRKTTAGKLAGFPCFFVLALIGVLLLPFAGRRLKNPPKSDPGSEFIYPMF